MAMTVLHLAGPPLIAGLMAGTGAIAPPAEPCGAQTWPYIDNRCVAAGTHEKRKVRVVMAPRDGVSAAASETSAAAPAAMPKMDAPTPAAPEHLVTRDAVARSVATGSPTAVPHVSRRAEQ